MKDDCIFCQIVSGKADAAKIYEDNKTVAFLSIQPIRPGHTLIIPKVHEGHLLSLPEDIYQAVMTTAYKLAPVLNDVYSRKRLGLLVAGWEIDHAHLHLVPMIDHFDLTSKRLLDGSAKFVTPRELALEKDKIESRLKSLL